MLSRIRIMNTARNYGRAMLVGAIVGPLAATIAYVAAESPAAEARDHAETQQPVAAARQLVVLDPVTNEVRAATPEESAALRAANPLPKSNLPMQIEKRADGSTRLKLNGNFRIATTAKVTPTGIVIDCVDAREAIPAAAGEKSAR